MRAPDGRPIYLDLRHIRLPVTGVLSIMHRIFGVLLSLSIPFFVYLFGLSLQGQGGFDEAAEILRQGWLIPLWLLLLWAFLHHLLSGIRYLLIDVEIGVARRPATRSARLIIPLAMLLTLVLGRGFWS
jgi:succinate dehydrogenase / fumarate reductase cytochrome b subunit